MLRMLSCTGCLHASSHGHDSVEDCPHLHIDTPICGCVYTYACHKQVRLMVVPQEQPVFLGRCTFVSRVSPTLPVLHQHFYAI